MEFGFKFILSLLFFDLDHSTIDQPQNRAIIFDNLMAKRRLQVPRLKQNEISKIDIDQ